MSTHDPGADGSSEGPGADGTAFSGPERPPGAGDPSYELAPVGRRIAAYLVDTVIFGIVCGVPYVVALSLLNREGVGESGIAVAFLLALVAFVVGAVVPAMLVARKGRANGQTLGKQLLGIRAVRDNGETYTFWPAMLREFLLKTLPLGILGCLVVIDFVWPLWEKESRTLHDLIASSHVVKD